MADRTIRTIYEAKVSGAEQALRSLSGKAETAARTADSLAASLRRAGEVKVNPKIDADIKAAESNVRSLTSTLKRLESQPSSAKIDADIKKFETKADDAQRTLTMLSRMDATPKVEADTKKAQAQLEDAQAKVKALQGMRAEVVAVADIEQARAELDKAQSQLKALQGAKAQMQLMVDADMGALDRARSEVKSFDGTKAQVQVAVDSAEVSGALKGVSSAARAEGQKAGDEAGEALIDGFKSTPIVGAVVGVLAAAGIAGVAAFKKGLEADLREDRFGALTGLDEKTSAKYGRAAGEAYANAWGDSLQDNMDAAKIARENFLIFDDDTQADIQRGIEQLQAVADLTGGDLQMTARAAGNMIKNGLAGSATEAYDMMVKGIQNNLNYSDDFLDTLEEYSPMFASLGLSGVESMALLDQAMQDGARSTDFAADAIKEFSIRAQDGSKTTAEAYEAMGFNAEEMSAKMAAGGESAREGFKEILKGLQAIEDPMARNSAGVALFGTKWEDLGNGANLVSLDLDNLGASWENVGSASEQAMKRMSDNNATAIEGAWRSLQTTFEQIAGALATAVGPELQRISEYVSNNRGEVMQWAVDTVHGLFDMARAAIDFGATMIEMSGTVAGGMAGIVEAIAGVMQTIALATGDAALLKASLDMSDTAQGMRDWASTSGEAADAFRSSMTSAVDDTEAKFDEWAGPAVLQAKLGDATTAMYGQLDEFSAYIDTVGGTVTINGATVNAEQALDMLVNAVNESDGTVTINGEKYPAEEALAGLKAQIDSSSGIVTIDGNNALADAALGATIGSINTSVGTMAIDANAQAADQKREMARQLADSTTGVMKIDANDQPAESVRSSTLGRINSSTGTLGIKGDDSDARGKLEDLTRPRFGSVSISATVSGLTGKLRSFFGLAHGGLVDPLGPRVTRGLAAGGYVPGPTPLPGTDNVLWPLARGGQVLSQPLAGGEFVMNPVSTAMWGPMLEWMNKGGKPADIKTQVSDAGTIASAVSSALSGWEVQVIENDRGFAARMKRVGAIR